MTTTTENDDGTENEHAPGLLPQDLELPEERAHGAGTRRRANGTLLPGNTANPGGRPANVSALQRMLAQCIRDQTDDGRDLVRILVKIAKGEPSPSGAVPSVIQQRAAAEYLLDRVAGKPLQTIAVDPNAGADALDLDRLMASTGLNLERLEVIITAALEGNVPPPAGAIIDVPAHATISQPSEHRTLDVKQSGPQPSDVKRLEVKASWRRVRLPNSSQIVGAEWDPDTHDCVVTFRARPGEPHVRWLYERVSREMIAAWEQAPSAGAWFARELRGGSGNEGKGAPTGLHLKHPRRRLPPPNEGADA